MVTESTVLPLFQKSQILWLLYKAGLPWLVFFRGLSIERLDPVSKIWQTPWQKLCALDEESWTCWTWLGLWLSSWTILEDVSAFVAEDVSGPWFPIQKSSRTCSNSKVILQTYILFTPKTSENWLNFKVASWTWKNIRFQQEARQKKIIIFNFERLYKKINYNIMAVIEKP